MADSRMALIELLWKSGHGDFLRSVAEAVLQLPVEARVHASNRSDSRARLTTTCVGLETGAYLSANEALKLLNLA
jgi:hypothetical protein